MTKRGDDGTYIELGQSLLFIFAVVGAFAGGPLVPLLMLTL